MFNSLFSVEKGAILYSYVSQDFDIFFRGDSDTFFEGRREEFYICITHFTGNLLYGFFRTFDNKLMCGFHTYLFQIFGEGLPGIGLEAFAQVGNRVAEFFGKLR